MAIFVKSTKSHFGFNSISGMEWGCRSLVRLSLGDSLCARHGIFKINKSLLSLILICFEVEKKLQTFPHLNTLNSFSISTTRYDPPSSSPPTYARVTLNSCRIFLTFFFRNSIFVQSYKCYSFKMGLIGNESAVNIKFSK